MLLDGMPYARGAGFISEKRCLPSTRQHLIDKIVEWVGTSDAPQRILVLSGQAGTGKSAVAHTIAEIFKKQNRLGSMFCFNRRYKDRCNLLFSTISRGLADSDVLWWQRLVKIIRDTSIKKSKDPVTQFDELIAKPSKNVATVGPVVIVIDALDESGERATILDLLFRRCSELPVNYRIIITSRPEQDIELVRDNPETIQCIRMGDIATDETLSDIQSYVFNRLKPIAPTLNKIDENWSQILAKRAEGLFQWAETACRFIDPDIRYHLIIQERWTTCVSGSSSSLYKLYEGIILSQRESENSQFVDNLKTIVSAIIMAREPLSVDALQNILQEEISDVRGVLYPFGSLFRGVNDLYTPIQPLHTSLFDFFADRSTKYHVNISIQGSFTLGCLKVMNRILRFNICNLETSHLSNRDIPNFSERVTKTIPSHLRYACYFWALHLNSLHSTDNIVTNNIVTEIRVLMEEKLLFWFEVLSLLNDIEQGCSAMIILRDWSQNAGSDLATLATQASDACHFGLTYKEAMSGSTPHLYLSALPFASQSSFISKQYLPQYPQLFSIDIDQSVDLNPTEIGVTKRHTSLVPITRLVFSPRDRYIASGFSNGEICLLDYKTGEQIKQWKPEMNTGSDAISDIVFSPDGELVYGCFPSVRRILIWNIKTNDVKQECYDSVIKKSSRFSTISSDGQYIAFDCRTEVLLYDRTNSTIIGHFKCTDIGTRKCQFSPSGNLFAFVKADQEDRRDRIFSRRTPQIVTLSGSTAEHAKGLEVNLWNTREQVPVKSWGGSGSLALSDSYIAVWKLNGHMEVWGLTTMTLVHNLIPHYLMQLKANHTEFSSNNEYVLSSLHNNTYCIWALSTGELVHQSHANGTICNITLSSDSNYIALADLDDTGTTYIRQWTPRRILQRSSPDGLTDNSLTIRNIWLHGAYLVLVSSHGLLQIWDITTMNTIVFEVMIGRSAALVFSVEDVLYVAYGVQTEKWDSHGFTSRYKLCLWKKSGRQLLLNAKGVVTALAFSVSKNYLIFGDDRGTLKIWDIHKRRFVFGPCSVEGTVKALDFSSSGTTVDVLVAYTKNSFDAYFEIRECQPGLRVLTGPFRCSVHSKFSFGDEIAFSANERYVVFISYEGVEIFDATTGSKVGWIDYQAVQISGRRLSPDGKYFAWVKDRELRLWDMHNNRLLLEDLSGGYVSVLCFSNDSKQLVAVTTTGSKDSKDQTFDINNSKDPVSIANDPKQPLLAVLMRRDDRMFQANSFASRVRYHWITIWDIQTMKLIIKKVRYPVFDSESFDVLALHDGHLVLGSSYSPRKIFWSLHVLSVAATLYDHYIYEAEFGTFPVNSSEIVRSSIPIINSSSAENMDSKVLDYSLTAWHKALFSNFSQMKSGWVLGPHGELLFWVPKEKRGGLWYPGMTHIIIKKITKLNFDNFVHGTRWTECRKAL